MRSPAEQQGSPAGGSGAAAASGSAGGGAQGSSGSGADGEGDGPSVSELAQRFSSEGWVYVGSVPTSEAGPQGQPASGFASSMWVRRSSARGPGGRPCAFAWYPCACVLDQLLQVWLWLLLRLIIHMALRLEISPRCSLMSQVQDWLHNCALGVVLSNPKGAVSMCPQPLLVVCSSPTVCSLRLPCPLSSCVNMQVGCGPGPR